MTKQKQLLLFAAVIVLGFVLIISYAIFSAVQRTGKIEVTVASSPDDAEIVIDGKKASNGANYLEPGNHTFTATKQGWQDAEINLTISEEVNRVNLILIPASTEATAWLNENPDEIIKREAFASSNAQLSGLATRKEYPIINKLPRSDIVGPYKIDYGFDDQDGHLFLLVSYSSTDGRKNAVEWLRSEGYKMSDLDVVFSDYLNPLVSEFRYD